MIDLQTRWNSLCDRWAASGYGALSAEDRVWLNIRSLIDSIENGGLISFFYNSGADTLPDCLAALRRLGAFAVAREVERVADLFPKGVPSSIDERNSIISAWPDAGPHDDLVAQVDEVVMPLMSDLEARLSAFLKDAEIGV